MSDMADDGEGWGGATPGGGGDMGPNGGSEVVFGVTVHGVVDFGVWLGIPFPWTSGLGINNGGGRGFLGDSFFSLFSFLSGRPSSEVSLILSFWPLKA